MRLGFTPLKGNCPVCNGARKDCRQSVATGLIHCREGEANPPDYMFRGLDKLGFGMWVQKAEIEAASEQQREEWRQQRETEKQRRLDAERAQRSQLLSEPDRDREIRRLLGQLQLSPEHRENLRQRGLSDEQIQAGMFRSVYQWQKLETPVSYRLAGISIDGRSLTNPQAGLLCPAWNAKGQIVGWQLRLDNADNGGKYRWPTSASQKRPNGATAHLTNGELPLTCCRPAGEPRKGIGLVEGILKPQITAQLSGQITIGAAGGNFASSPSTLEAYLVQLEPEIVEAPPLILYPDAGAIANKNVMRQYRQTHALLEKWGYELRVAWWGQVSKKDLDIDELLAARRGEEIEIITWAQFEALAHNLNQLLEGVADLFRNLKQRLGNSFKGFGRPPAPKPIPAPKPLAPNPTQSKPVVLNYVPGALPSFKECGGKDLGTVRYKKGQRKRIWKEAARKGWKHVLDKSGPGLGKSYTAGITNPRDLGVEKLFYFASNHRNPTTDVIEANYTDVPVRNAGMKRDSSHQTPLGRDWIVWSQKGEQPDTPGNCHRQPLFAALRSKNLPGIEGSESPICGTCHLRDACRGSSGDGFGFRSQRREAFESNRLRAHPNSAPQTDDFDFSSTGAFWDEAATLIQPMTSVSVKLLDFEQVMGYVESQLPDVYESLKPLRLKLRPLLNGEIKALPYGFDDGAIRALLPNPPDDLLNIIKELEAALKPDLSLLDLTKKHGVEMAHLPDRLKRKFRGKPSELVEQLNQSTLLNWLVPFLKVWSGERGAFRCNYGFLTISTRDDRHSKIVAATKFNIYLDATTTSKHLALLLDITPADILVIEQKQPNHQNLRFVHVTGLGQLGKDRSDFLKARVAAIKSELTSRHPESIRYLDWGAQALAGEGRWFVDSRGSNDFMECQAIASFGIPYQNLGHLQALYQTLTGRYVALDRDNPDPEFQAFVDAHTQGEIIQAVGRLRSHLRPTEQLTYYFCGDYDLSFLRVPVKQVDAFTITPQAGSETQQGRWTLLQAFKQLTETGEKITQVTLAAAAGISQSRVSQRATEVSEVRGWEILKKILGFLLKTPYSNSNNFEPLTEDELWLAKDYLPVVLEDSPNDALSQVIQLAKASGWKTFEALLIAVPLEFKAKLLSLIIGFMPESVQAKIQSLALEPTSQ
ncbi:hypothetical protein NDI44_22405 [Trichocoleus sp. DQ-A3]|uniref:hypothetical protein n=1 Tax=Cyanophyceae TaxID=3028117 RepID=UPI0016822036|nr:hypothetical protein [Coleofasciculus sp. FACHB-125]MBD1903790.1 hypothetical protein [Coleofasciculus sp. FACHB-125]